MGTELNPVRGFDIPKEKNPQRAAVTQQRHEAMLEAAEKVKMEVSWGDERQKVHSHLKALLILANGTGRRISSVCELRWQDVHFGETRSAPHGSITWRAESDKEGYEWKKIPIRPEVRQALQRVRRDLPGLGSAPVFPRAKDRSEPIDVNMANRWFREAEEHMEMDPMPKGRTWHGYRAKFAAETKHLDDKNRAEMGGWKCSETIRRVYDQADPDGMLQVIEDRKELREAR